MENDELNDNIVKFARPIPRTSDNARMYLFVLCTLNMPLCCCEILFY